MSTSIQNILQIEQICMYLYFSFGIMDFLIMLLHSWNVLLWQFRKHKKDMQDYFKIS